MFIFATQLSIYQGDKVEKKELKDIAKVCAIVVFWTKNCFYCKDSLKQLDNFKKKYKDIQCYAVDIERESNQPALEKYKKLCPTLSKISYILDIGGKVFDYYTKNEPARGYPYVIIFNKKGEPKSKHLGMCDLEKL